jgi:acetylornithine/succinyldiaminopimelate/putrescine aminotransferase
MTDWQELESRYFFSVYKRLPVTLVRGQGVRVWDDQGKSTWTSSPASPR